MLSISLKMLLTTELFVLSMFYSSFNLAFTNYSSSSGTTTPALALLTTIRDYCLNAETQHCDLIPQQNFRSDPHNFQGRKLRIIFEKFWSLPTPAVGTRSAYTNGSWFHFYGTVIPHCWDLQDFLNFTIEPMLLKHISLRGPNETYEALVGSGGAELSSIVLIDLSLMKNLAVLHPTFSHWQYIFFKQPHANLNRLVFIQPFTPSAWAGLLLIWTVVILLTSLIVRFNKNQSKKGMAYQSAQSSVGIGEVISWGICTITGKAYRITIPNPSFKIVAIAGHVLSVILLSLYSAFIVSSFSFKQEPIKTLQDLLDYGYDFVGFSDYPNPNRYTTNQELAAHLTRRTHLNFVNFSDTAQKTFSSGMTKVDEAGNSYVAPYFAAFEIFYGFFLNANFLKKSTCEMCEISYLKSLSRSQNTLIVRKGSKLKESLNWKLIQIMESGLNRRYKTIFYDLAGVPRCEVASQSKWNTIGINDVGIGIYIWIVGLALALISIGLERVIRTNKLCCSVKIGLRHYVTGHMNL